MKSQRQIRKQLESMKPYLEQEYHVKEIGIFGSYVRGEQKETSDLDLLVTFTEPIGLIKLVRLENELSHRLGVQVDLVTEKSLKPQIRKQVDKEVVYA